MKKILASILALCMVLSTMGTFDFAGESEADVWDGTVDTSWYNDTDTEFVITTAEQLAGLAELVDDGNDFAGKTIIPFATSGGSGMGKTNENLLTSCEGAVLKEGRVWKARFWKKEADPEEVSAWAKEKLNEPQISELMCIRRWPAATGAEHSGRCAA